MAITLSIQRLGLDEIRIVISDMGKPIHLRGQHTQSISNLLIQPLFLLDLSRPFPSHISRTP
jgi:hypothetical protein